ncbi:MAG: hypothetical protein PVF33_01535 [Candidatus Latescibacterota bacterium]
MNEERKQILTMLADGKITAEEAERLMDKIESGESRKNPVSTPPAQGGKLKYLRVLVDSADGDKVNIRVPLALIRTGIKLAAVLPNDVNEKLGEKGVDLGKLSELDGDELYETLNELQVDVDAGNGDTVRVFCE